MSKVSMVGPKLAALTSLATWKAGLKSGLKSKIGSIAPCPLIGSGAVTAVQGAPVVGTAAGSLVSANVGGAPIPAAGPAVVRAPEPVPTA